MQGLARTRHAPPMFSRKALVHLAWVGLVLADNTLAADWGHGIEASFSGVATFGTAVRTEDPSPGLLGRQGLGLWHSRSHRRPKPWRPRRRVGRTGAGNACWAVVPKF